LKNLGGGNPKRGGKFGENQGTQNGMEETKGNGGRYIHPRGGGREKRNVREGLAKFKEHFGKSTSYMAKGGKAKSSYAKGAWKKGVRHDKEKKQK